MYFYYYGVGGFVNEILHLSQINISGRLSKMCNSPSPHVPHAGLSVILLILLLRLKLGKLQHWAQRRRGEGKGDSGCDRRL